MADQCDRVYTLQSATNLVPQQWLGPPVTGQFAVTNPISGSQRSFYRLSQ